MIKIKTIGDIFEKGKFHIHLKKKRGGRVSIICSPLPNLSVCQKGGRVSIICSPCPTYLFAKKGGASIKYMHPSSDAPGIHSTTTTSSTSTTVVLLLLLSYNPTHRQYPGSTPHSNT